MQEKHLYEYAVVRYVPNVTRQEFINVGLIMMCKRLKWLRFAKKIDFSRISPFNPPHTQEEITDALAQFAQVAETGKISPTSDVLPPEERFRWLTAVKSCAIQTSRPHPGLSDNLDTTFNKLLEEQVL